jgi:hypothetical protein
MEIKKLILVSAICPTMLFAACGTGENPAANSPTEAQTAVSEKTVSSDVPTTATGIASCDDYFAKIGKFLSNPNVPQTVRDAYRQSLEQNRLAWRQAVSSPQGKAQLETSCRTALDSIKPALEQYDK